MNISQHITSLIDAIERSASVKLSRRTDVECLLELTSSGTRSRLRDELLFYAKFVNNAYHALTRAGTTSADTTALARELQSSAGKVSDLLRDAIVEAPGDVREAFERTYLDISQSGMSNLLGLAGDLARVKNYAIDHKGIL